MSTIAHRVKLALTICAGETGPQLHKNYVLGATDPTIAHSYA